MAKGNKDLAVALWASLRKAVFCVEDTDTLKLLEAVKNWINENLSLLGDDFTSKHPALSLLMQTDGTQFQFNNNVLESVQHFKTMLQSQLFIFESLDDLADVLEELIQTIIVFTKFQTCPICQEGVLGYWIEFETKDLVLCCFECGYQQNSTGERWISKGRLLPALKKDLHAIDLKFV